MREALFHVVGQIDSPEHLGQPCLGILEYVLMAGMAC